MSDPAPMTREDLIRGMMATADCGRQEAEVILRRIAARLDGMTHAEAVAAYPLPAEDET